MGFKGLLKFLFQASLLRVLCGGKVSGETGGALGVMEFPKLWRALNGLRIRILGLSPKVFAEGSTTATRSPKRPELRERRKNAYAEPR